jgi:hypothetical protein
VQEKTREGGDPHMGEPAKDDPHYGEGGDAKPDAPGQKEAAERAAEHARRVGRGGREADRRRVGRDGLGLLTGVRTGPEGVRC